MFHVCIQDSMWREILIFFGFWDELNKAWMLVGKTFWNLYERGRGGFHALFSSLGEVFFYYNIFVCIW